MKPLSALYGRAAALRRAWYERHPAARRRLVRPVISVGNLSVGGSGKTPVVAAIARLLLEMGERPAILSRGYGRRAAADGVVVVSDGRSVLATVRQSGDEPQMLAKALPSVPVLVSSDRYLAGRLAEARFDATVHVLDDAFQHLQLARTIDLLLVSAHDLADQVLPSGRLREPLSAARAADAVLTYRADDRERIAEALGVAASFSVQERHAAIRAVAGDAVDIDVRRVAAVAGIARPARLSAALRTLGYDVVRELTFRDHHWFTAADVARIEAAARDAGAALIVTTEKDAVRLAGLDLRGRWTVLPMDVEVERSFAPWLASRLHLHERGAPAFVDAAADGQLA